MCIISCETKEAFDIFGIETVCSLTGAEGFISPAELWQKCQGNGEYDRLLSNSGELPDFISQDLCKVHAAEYYRKTEESTFPYMLCAFISKNRNTDGYKTVHIPSQTYVVFSSEKFKWDDEFFKILTTMQKRFYREWLPTAKYERAEGANFEIYGGTAEYGYIVSLLLVFSLLMPVNAVMDSPEITPEPGQVNPYKTRSELLMDATRYTGVFTPEQAAHVWSEGLEMRSAAMQYTVMIDKLRQDYAGQLDALRSNWVTGMSSPSVVSHTFTKINKADKAHTEIVIRFEVAATASPSDYYDAELWLVREGIFGVSTHLAR